MMWYLSTGTTLPLYVYILSKIWGHFFSSVFLPNSQTSASSVTQTLKAVWWFGFILCI